MCRDYQDISEISNHKNPDVALVSDVNNICRKSICGKSEWEKKKKGKTNYKLSWFPVHQTNQQTWAHLSLI